MPFLVIMRANRLAGSEGSRTAHALLLLVEALARPRIAQHNDALVKDLLIILPGRCSRDWNLGPRPHEDAAGVLGHRPNYLNQVAPDALAWHPIARARPGCTIPRIPMNDPPQEQQPQDAQPPSGQVLERVAKLYASWLVVYLVSQGTNGFFAITVDRVDSDLIKFTFLNVPIHLILTALLFACLTTKTTARRRIGAVLAWINGVLILGHIIISCVTA